MHYQEALDYIENIQVNLGSDYSLKDVTELSNRAGRPDRKRKVIHIAGTNGKGSVGNYISNMLACAGYTVGRYVSPTIIEYRERIQKLILVSGKVHCEYISEEEVAFSLSFLKEHCETMQKEGYGQPTAFEIETVMAFLMFEKWQVDVAVVETGLGGRLDATNIVEHPLQCVFTSISMDHMQILGKTIEEIAREKYGIIKSGTEVISLEQADCNSLLREICEQKDVKLHFVHTKDIQKEKLEIGNTVFFYQDIQYVLKQTGLYQMENAALAIEAVLHLKRAGFHQITDKSMKKGLLESKWKGRFEIISQNPFLLADGAHNPDAAKKLRTSLETYFPNETFQFIFGVFRDKEYQEFFSYLLPLAEQVYTVTAPGKRGLPGNQLCDCIKELLTDKKCDNQTKKDNMQTTLVSEDIFVCKTVEEALNITLNKHSDRKTIVCGSLSILGDVYQYMDNYNKSRRNEEEYADR